MNIICQFTLGKKYDHYERSIEQLWALDPFWLEYDLDYIQWLFPIDNPKLEIIRAPIVCQTTRDYFQISDVLRRRQLHSLKVMLNFFGMEMTNNTIKPLASLNINDHLWLQAQGYNHQRIRQIIRSLALLGQVELSSLFQMAMIDTARKHGCVPESILQYWQTASLIEMDYSIALPES
ncbi:opioid growth factor receptor-related protein [Vibrio rarus]|uniref:opioid growth factor receptor-related protein n=1 Tax=Vibrio rarus TaxID=413403 RepID=UPI0021C3C83C|nr:opioid growth factor receptor-related protein [Vibrio rarus]